jgi:hypothetical protein
MPRGEKVATAREGDGGSVSRRRSRFARAALCGAPALLAGAAAAAPNDAARAAGEWTVTASRDGTGCFVTRTYPRRGGTTVLFGLDLDGKNRLTVLNPNWSIKPGERLKLDYAFARSRYPGHFAVGIAADGKQGFVSSFDKRFPTHFAGSDRLTITRGEVPVERIALDGSGAALAEVRRCLTTLGSATAGASADDDIPADPFAPAPKRKRGK